MALGAVSFLSQRLSSSVLGAPTPTHLGTQLPRSDPGSYQPDLLRMCPARLSCGFLVVAAVWETLGKGCSPLTAGPAVSNAVVPVLGAVTYKQSKQHPPLPHSIPGTQRSCFRSFICLLSSAGLPLC